MYLTLHVEHHRTVSQSYEMFALTVCLHSGEQESDFGAARLDLLHALIRFAEESR